MQGAEFEEAVRGENKAAYAYLQAEQFPSPARMNVLLLADRTVSMQRHSSSTALSLTHLAKIVCLEQCLGGDWKVLAAVL